MLKRMFGPKAESLSVLSIHILPQNYVCKHTKFIFFQEGEDWLVCIMVVCNCVLSACTIAKWVSVHPINDIE